MQAGTLNRRITVQRRTGAVDELGAPLPDAWEDYALIWANIRAPSGMGSISAQFQSAGQEISRVMYSMRVRYRKDITADMRVLYQGEAYEIRQVIHDLAGREHTDIVCAFGARNG